MSTTNELKFGRISERAKAILKLATSSQLTAASLIQAHANIKRFAQSALTLLEIVADLDARVTKLEGASPTQAPVAPAGVPPTPKPSS